MYLKVLFKVWKFVNKYLNLKLAVLYFSFLFYIPVQLDKYYEYISQNSLLMVIRLSGNLNVQQNYRTEITFFPEISYILSFIKK